MRHYTAQRYGYNKLLSLISPRGVGLSAICPAAEEIPCSHI